MLMRSTTLILALVLTLIPAAFLPAQEARVIPDEVVQPGGDHPLGAWEGVPPSPAAVAADTLWSLRTGLRKGITELTLDDELFAAPDVAVLRSGFFASWSGLLAEFREPSVLVEPDGIAGLARTKPALIIPSGGLAGLARSGFFRAALAEYVHAGGVILCFSQQKSADFAALPVPAGTALQASGWTEDSGPLFRASSVRRSHPVLAGLSGSTPALETDGFITSAPEAATVLLARTDGRATLVLYAVDKGWVVVAALASDYAATRGYLEQDEKALVRDLVRWAKTGGRLPELRPETEFKTTLSVRGSGREDASAVRITVLSPDGTRVKHELADRVIPLDVKSSRTATLPYVFWIPTNTNPGIYHLEYTLSAAEKRPLTPPAEVTDGWFAVMPTSRTPEAASPPARPLAASLVRIAAATAIERTGDRTTLTVAISRTDGSSEPQDLLVRAAGRERTVKIIRDALSVSLDLGGQQPEGPVVYAIHDRNGRAIASGIAMEKQARGAGVTVDRPAFRGGQTIRVKVAGMGPGALTITGLGTELNESISEDRVFELPVADALPAGSYPVAWKFQTMRGERKEGVIPVMIKGAEVRCTGAAVTTTPEGPAEALFSLNATERMNATVRFWLVGPGGAALPAVETPLAIVPGHQTAAFPFTFRPDRAGMWHMLYTVTATLPEAAGLFGAPVTLAAGRTVIDAGDVAILGFSTGLPLYYDTAVPAEITAYVYGTGGAKVELMVDGKRIARKRTEAAGLSAITARLDDLRQGRHTLSASAAGAGLSAFREQSFLYGARLPDLTVTLRTADPMSPLLEIGVGVINQGKSPAGHVMAALYEGDPERGGTLIGRSAVPPLDPGKQFVLIFKWPLAGKEGSHRFTAFVDREEAVTEINDANNSAALSLSIPAVVLTLMSQKESYAADDAISYRIGVVNFSSRSLPSLEMDLQITDPAGALVSRESVTLPPLAIGADQTIERPFGLATLREGTYLISARVSADRPLASDSLGITLLPTLLLSGDLEGTAPIAAPCRPFEIHYTVRDAGNVPAMNGALTVEIRSSDQDQVVFTKQLPFALGTGTVRIDRIDLPRGEYTIHFRGSAVNPQRSMNREFLLSRRELTVAGPVHVTRSRAAIPRVLIWTGGETTTPIEQALADKMVQDAFEGQAAYREAVSSAEAFKAQALTGLFNTYLLLEVGEIGGAVGALQRGLDLGHGVILAGPGEHTRSIAEALGFRFTPLRSAVPSLTFPASTALGLTGSIPVAGPVLAVAKSGARTVAVLPDGQPGALLDDSGSGRIIVTPFSPIHSALNTGASAPYGLLLRSAIRAVMPEQDGRAIATVQLQIDAPAGPVKARIVETLPPGAKVLWMSEAGKEQRGTLSFDMTAQPEPRTILYLFRPDSTDGRTETEVFSECRGKLISQGKVE